MKQFFRAAILLAGSTGVFGLHAALAQTDGADGASIAAVVNGQVITSGDVTGRARLLALSTGMNASPDMLAKLSPQISKELIDQTLQLQEINRRSVVVPESDVVSAVTHIEQNNNMQPGGLRKQLEAAGVPFSALVAQLRVELGWQTVLHQVLGPGLQPLPGDINAEKKALSAEIGTTKYHIAEIFIPVTDPADDSQAKDFANTVITQLRAGAPFPIVAAQFSQADSALEGGDLGFVSLSQLDPATAAVVTTMPAGAVSNPIRVPGGYDIVQLLEIHPVGSAMQTILNIREAFAPYTTAITNGQVGPAQAAVINQLVQAGHGVHSCDDMTALNARLGNIRPADPGPVNLANVTPPQFQALLAGLTPGQVSRPLVAQDGTSLIIVCSRQNEAAALPSDDDIAQIIVERRVSMESQELLDDLRHKSIITQN